MKKLFIVACLLLAWQFKADACTGISMFSADGSYFQARTIEWAGSNLNSVYVVVPRNFSQTSFTPKGKNGMTFKAKYGYVGLAVEEKEFVAEGLNEAGLSIILIMVVICFMMRDTIQRQYPTCSWCRGCCRSLLLLMR